MLPPFPRAFGERAVWSGPSAGGSVHATRRLQRELLQDARYAEAHIYIALIYRVCARASPARTHTHDCVRLLRLHPSKRKPVG